MKGSNTGFNARQDTDGYLLEPNEWDQQVAFDLASHAGIETLTADHWKVLNWLREHYNEDTALPMIRRTCKDVGLEEHCVTHLFGDPTVAWRIAGLPNPGEEAKAYMPTSELE